MHSGGLPERTNDRLACAGRLGIRFLSGVLGVVILCFACTQVRHAHKNWHISGMVWSGMGWSG